MRQDISGHVLDRLVDQIFKVVERMDKLLPLGPTGVSMSQSELLKKTAGSGTLGVSTFQDDLGEQEVLRMLQDGANIGPEGESKAQPREEEASEESRIYSRQLRAPQD